MRGQYSGLLTSAGLARLAVTAPLVSAIVEDIGVTEHAESTEYADSTEHNDSFGG
jgi:hypothetical protein